MQAGKTVTPGVFRNLIIHKKGESVCDIGTGERGFKQMRHGKLWTYSRKNYIAYISNVKGKNYRNQSFAKSNILFRTYKYMVKSKMYIKNEL